jgi:hypothetical protein
MLGKKGEPQRIEPAPQVATAGPSSAAAPLATPVGTAAAIPVVKAAAPPVAPPTIEPVPPPPAAPTVDATPPAHAHKKHEHAPAAHVAAPRTPALPSVNAGTPEPATAHPTATAATAPKSPFAEGEALFRGGDVQGALARYQDAARANPSDAKAQRQIGKCYNRLGQRDRALPYLKRYLELAPDASDAAFIRAMIEQK